MTELTILMPCLNEAETVATCVDKARRFLEDRGIDGEVLVADNGSIDGSPELATSHGARVVLVAEKGYGSALMGGIKAAKGRYVIMGDADDSYDFSELDAFIEHLRAGEQVVMGNRFAGGIQPGAMPALHRYLGNPVLSRIGRLFFNVPCADFHCGLRGFERGAILALDLRSPGMEFASELVVRAVLKGYAVGEVPVTLHPDGRSRPPHLRSWRDGWRHLRFLLLFSPRWLFLYPGLLLSVGGGLLVCALVVSPLELGPVRLGAGALVAASILTVIGYQAVLFACLTKVHAQAEGFLPPDPRFNRVFRYVRLETGLVAGVAIFLLGMGAAVVSYIGWRDAHWGALEAGWTVRAAVPAALGLVLGSQLILSSFFLSILGLRRAHPDGHPIVVLEESKAMSGESGASLKL
ncbi:MAG TPA: glycosyltransferase family 2 protein [Acidimicrobiales bacterium]|nr:glycosyltransferase family 2 protein [Acidimicrobiales bacterium]